MHIRSTPSHHIHWRPFALTTAVIALLTTIWCRGECAIAIETSGLEPIGALTQNDLRGAVSATVSLDGKHLYVASWLASTVHVFDRNPDSGQLTQKQAVMSRDDLRGVLCLRLSPNGEFAIATAIRSKTVSLYRRDETTGLLTRADIVRHDQETVALPWPTDAVFSPDSRFAHVIDDRAGSVNVFRITDAAKLDWVETNVGSDECFDGARGIAMHPDGKTLFVAASRAGTLCVVDRDTESGKLKVRQVLRDGESNIRSLGGAQGVCCSSDGRFIYTCSGRNRGDHAVSAFQLGSDGKLILRQEFVNGEGELRDFMGGNEIMVSPDGLSVYASGTLSGSLACFQRDPTSGTLSYLTTLRDQTTGAEAKLGVGGICIDPSGRIVYLALENDSTISIFSRRVSDKTD